MKRDGMKIGLLVTLVAASGAIFYGQYASEPKRVTRVLTPTDEAKYQEQVRLHEKLSELPGYIKAGS